MNHSRHALARTARALVSLCFLVLTACNEYWSGQGQAARTGAAARLAEAQAAQQNAQAAILDAEARGNLAGANADALRTLVDVNADYTRQAMAMADSQADAWVWAGLAVIGAVLIIGIAAIWLAMRYRSEHDLRLQPPPEIQVGPRVIGMISTPAGPLPVWQLPGEARRGALERAREQAELLGGGSWRQLPPPPDR